MRSGYLPKILVDGMTFTGEANFVRKGTGYEQQSTERVSEAGSHRVVAQQVYGVAVFMAVATAMITTLARLVFQPVERPATLSR
jgi:hypothetical protein